VQIPTPTILGKDPSKSDSKHKLTGDESDRGLDTIETNKAKAETKKEERKAILKNARAVQKTARAVRLGIPAPEERGLAPQKLEKFLQIRNSEIEQRPDSPQHQLKQYVRPKRMRTWFSWTRDDEVYFL